MMWFRPHILVGLLIRTESSHTGFKGFGPTFVYKLIFRWHPTLKCKTEEIAKGVEEPGALDLMRSIVPSEGHRWAFSTLLPNWPWCVMSTLFRFGRPCLKIRLTLTFDPKLLCFVVIMNIMKVGNVGSALKSISSFLTCSVHLLLMISECVGDLGEISNFQLVRGPQNWVLWHFQAEEVWAKLLMKVV